MDVLKNVCYRNPTREVITDANSYSLALYVPALTSLTGLSTASFPPPPHPTPPRKASAEEERVVATWVKKNRQKSSHFDTVRCTWFLTFNDVLKSVIDAWTQEPISDSDGLLMNRYSEIDKNIFGRNLATKGTSNSDENDLGVLLLWQFCLLACTLNLHWADRSRCNQFCS